MFDRVSSRRGVLGGVVSAAAVAVSWGTGVSGRPADRNREVVLGAFDRAAREGTLSSGGGFYPSLLAEDVRWTVAAWPPRTYTSLRQFVAEGARPVLDRLDGPIVPRVLRSTAEGDTVAVYWEGTATARDGLRYDNVYHWTFTMRDDRAVEVVAFLDLVVLNELLDRVPPG